MKPDADEGVTPSNAVLGNGEPLVADLLVSVPPGWRALVDLLVRTMDAVLLAAGRRVQVLQVKEKFAGLRLYYAPLAPALDAATAEALVILVRAAERASMSVCDRCGMPGAVRKSHRGYYRTRCDHCAERGSLRVEDDGSDLSETDRRTPSATATPWNAHRTWLRDDAGALSDPGQGGAVAVAALALCRDVVCDADGAPKVRHVLKGMSVREGRLYLEITFDRRRRRTRETLLSMIVDTAADVQSDDTVPPAPAAEPRSPQRGPRKAEADAAQDDLTRPSRSSVAPAKPHAGAHRAALYELDDVAAALGMTSTDDSEAGSGTEHRGRLRGILHQGEEGRWRSLAAPTTVTANAISALGARAPHMAELTDLALVHARSAMNVGLPTAMPAILLVGEPGTGKTWFLSRLAKALGVPFRTHPMNGSSLSETLFGSAPSWRNASPGLVATTLLREGVANPVIFVDEFDKAGGNSINVDPYRPFYTLLEPDGARTFVDEYLGFPVDASHVIWFMSANTTSSVPPPILDRLLVMHVPALGPDALRAVAASVYAEGNLRRRCFFTDQPSRDVILALGKMKPRGMRIAIDRAMVRASADGRREIDVSDLPTERDGRRRMGFI